MTNTTQTTIEHIEAASNRSYDQVICEPNCRTERRGHKSKR